MRLWHNFKFLGTKKIIKLKWSKYDCSDILRNTGSYFLHWFGLGPTQFLFQPLFWTSFVLFGLKNSWYDIGNISIFFSVGECPASWWHGSWLGGPAALLDRLERRHDRIIGARRIISKNDREGQSASSTRRQGWSGVQVSCQTRITKYSFFITGTELLRGCNLSMCTSWEPFISEVLSFSPDLIHIFLIWCHVVMFVLSEKWIESPLQKWV